MRRKLFRRYAVEKENAKFSTKRKKKEKLPAKQNRLRPGPPPLGPIQSRSEIVRGVNVANPIIPHEKKKKKKGNQGFVRQLIIVLQSHGASAPHIENKFLSKAAHANLPDSLIMNAKQVL